MRSNSLKNISWVPKQGSILPRSAKEGFIITVSYPPKIFVALLHEDSSKDRLNLERDKFKHFSLVE
jgi:hypothetical protein